ncbi:MAG: hypothetical protein J7L15_09480 [Clostridiales bacterium]|nr:hypothetical protein [Clostridiales bacterium]
MAQTKPFFKPEDIWASSANAANKQKPNQSKLDTGWVYGELPPHNEFNWWWNLVGQMLQHIQEYGTPAWDDTTSYQNGALTWYNDVAWMSKSSGNVGNVPDETLGFWTALVSVDALDTLIPPLIPFIPEISELNGKQLLYVTDWDIGNSYLHLDQVTVNTAS